MASTELRGRMIPEFIAQVKSVGGRVRQVPDLAGAGDYIVKLAIASNAKRIVLASRELARELSFRDAALEQLEIVCQTDMPRERFFNAVKIADIGVTPVDLAVAETGTVILATLDELERLATALPRIHVALLSHSRIVFSLQDAEPYVSRFLERASKGAVVSFISGPSRTADVEGRLVVGVHGPQELHICLVGQEPRGGH